VSTTNLHGSSGRVTVGNDFLPWRWRWNIPPKHRFTYGLQGDISQKMASFNRWSCCSLWGSCRLEGKWLILLFRNLNVYHLFWRLNVPHSRSQCYELERHLLLQGINCKPSHPVPADKLVAAVRYCKRLSKYLHVLWRQYRFVCLIRTARNNTWQITIKHKLVS
jgi:hypothetical protein